MDMNIILIIVSMIVLGGLMYFGWWTENRGIQKDETDDQTEAEREK